MKEIPIPEAKLSELLYQSEVDQLPILLTENNEMVEARKQNLEFRQK